MHLITYTNDLPALIARAKEIVDNYSYISREILEATDDDDAIDIIRMIMPKTRTHYNIIDGVTHSASHIQLPHSQVFGEDGEIGGFMGEFAGILDVIGTDMHESGCPHQAAWSQPDTLLKYDLAFPLAPGLDEDGNETGNLMPRRKFGGFDI